MEPRALHRPGRLGRRRGRRRVGHRAALRPARRPDGAAVRRRRHRGRLRPRRRGARGTGQARPDPRRPRRPPRLNDDRWSVQRMPDGARIRACRSRVRVRSVRTSTTRMPDGVPSCLRRSSSESTGCTPCRWPRRARRGRRRAACRRPARTPPACSGAPCSSRPKIPPPSSLTTTTVRSGRGSSGPITSPVLSCRNVRSPISAYAGPPCARAAPIAVDTVPSMPEAPRLASDQQAARLPRVGEVEVADRAGRPGDQQAARRHGRGQHAGHRAAVSAGSATSTCGDGVERPARRRPASGASQAGVARRPVTCRASRGVVRAAGRPRRRRGRSSRVTGRDSVGRPAHDHPLDVAAEVVEQQPVGRQRVRPGPCDRTTARPAAASRRPRPAPRVGQRLVAGDDDGARPPAASIGRAPSAAVPASCCRSDRRVERLGPRRVAVGNQRFAEARVEVHRAGRAGDAARRPPRPATP